MRCFTIRFLRTLQQIHPFAKRSDFAKGSLQSVKIRGTICLGVPYTKPFLEAWMAFPLEAMPWFPPWGFAPVSRRLGGGNATPGGSAGSVHPCLGVEKAYS